MNAIDPKTIAWTPWSVGDYWRDSALVLADDWLGDFGLALFGAGPGAPPDAWASLGDGKFAFRFQGDFADHRSVCVFVHIDYDGAPDGHDTCQRVEVVRG